MYNVGKFVGIKRGFDIYTFRLLTTEQTYVRDNFFWAKIIYIYMSPQIGTSTLGRKHINLSINPDVIRISWRRITLPPFPFFLLDLTLWRSLSFALRRVSTLFPRYLSSGIGRRQAHCKRSLCIEPTILRGWASTVNRLAAPSDSVLEELEDRGEEEWEQEPTGWTSLLVKRTL